MCPDDSNGIYNVPIGTLVNSGDTVLPSQHNPWANDSASAISNRFSKDGRAPATGTWNLNTFRITNLGTPVASADAVNKSYADATYATPAALALKLDVLQPSVDVASAATTDIGGAASQNVRITGTTTITSLGTVAAGTLRRVIFTGSLTLTHNATSLILPGAINITTAAGDIAEFISEGSGNWRCLSYLDVLYPPTVAVGAGQTWQDVSASRTHSTPYQNTTGRPIEVAIVAGNTARNIEVSVNSSTWIVVGSISAVAIGQSSITIPNNWYYRINGSTTIIAWAELR